MKKIYETSDMEVSKFTLAADIISESESELGSKNDVTTFGLDSGVGFGL